MENGPQCSVSNKSISTFDAGRLSQGHGGEEGGARAVQCPPNSKVHEEGYVMLAEFPVWKTSIAFLGYQGAMIIIESEVQKASLIKKQDVIKFLES